MSTKRPNAKLIELFDLFGNIFTLKQATKVFNTSTTETSKILSRWYKQGWVNRITKNLYNIVPIEATSTDQALDNIWIIVPYLFNPGYIGGWTATEYWDFTEQIFIDTCVLTEKVKYTQEKIFNHIRFVIHPLKPKFNFGTTFIWVNNKKVLISDPHKTIIDMMISSYVGAGSQHTVDCFCNYIRGEHFDYNKLFEYAVIADNGAVFKRLGFLSSQILGDDHQLTILCSKLISKGYSYLDTTFKNNQKLITKWNLYIPNDFKIGERE